MNARFWIAKMRFITRIYSSLASYDTNDLFFESCEFVRLRMDFFGTPCLEHSGNLDPTSALFSFVFKNPLHHHHQLF